MKSAADFPAITDESLMTNPPPAPNPARQLNLFDCVCIIVGTIVGAGIFMTPTIIAGAAPSQWWMLAVWCLGGLIAIAGALCFAELTTNCPDAGGDYGYLKRAFGKPIGFAFSWTSFWIVRPGNIGAMAFTFGQFASIAAPKSLSSFAWAALAVTVISGLNMIGVQSGKTTQNILTVVKISGISMLLIAATLLQPSSSTSNRVESNPSINETIEPIAAEPTLNSESAKPSSEWFWFSMVMVMFAFGGWNDIAFVASEVQQPKRNLLRALLLGTFAVVAIYLLVNISLLYGLGFDQLKTVASSNNGNGPMALVKQSLGPVGEKLLSIAVCLSCLGAISAMVFTSPRIYWATAEDYWQIQSLIGDRMRNWQAILIQGLVTVSLMVSFSLTNQGFNAIVNACAPYFWAFLSLTILALVVNRWRSTEPLSGFKVPFYPLPLILFIVACWFMTFRSFQYMLDENLQIQAAVIGAWVATGLATGIWLSGLHPPSKTPVNP